MADQTANASSDHDQSCCDEPPEKRIRIAFEDPTIINPYLIDITANMKGMRIDCFGFLELFSRIPTIITYILF